MPCVCLLQIFYFLMWTCSTIFFHVFSGLFFGGWVVITQMWWSQGLELKSHCKELTIFSYGKLLSCCPDLWSLLAKVTFFKRSTERQHHGSHFKYYMPVPLMGWFRPPSPSREPTGVISCSYKLFILLIILLLHVLSLHLSCVCS